MSTPNFYTKNASKVFASWPEEEFEFNDLMDNVLCELKLERITEHDNERSYPGLRFGKMEVNFGKWRADIYLVSRDAYYSGLNLDWEIDIYDPNEDEVYEYKEVKIPATLQNLIDSKIIKIEKVYAEYTTPLICRGVFSNGEAVYEKSSLITA